MAGVKGVVNVIHSLIPLKILCDKMDVGVSELWGNFGCGFGYYLIFWDTYEGGSGVCEKSWECIQELIRDGYDLIKNCNCDEGCMSCVKSWGRDEDVNKYMAKKILYHLIIQFYIYL